MANQASKGQYCLVSGGRLLLGLRARCWLLEPAAKMPLVISEVLTRLDGRMRMPYHQWQGRSGMNISSPRVDVGNPGLTILERTIAGLGDITSRADANEDGRINTADIAAIRKDHYWHGCWSTKAAQ